MNEKSIALLKNVSQILIPLLVILFSWIALPKTIFILLVLALLVLWLAGFCLDGTYPSADLPTLLLILGTFAYGKAFSIIGINAGPLPVYITETLLALALFALIAKERSFMKPWQKWSEFMPPYLMPILMIYVAAGTVYLLLGLKTYGARAFRDITFCHYMVLLFLVLFLFDRQKKLNTFPRLFAPAVVIVFLFGLVSLFYRIPGSSAFKQFIRDTKMTSLAMSCGLILIFGLSFLAYIKNKKLKAILLFTIYFSFLLLVMAEVRAGWAGMLVTLIFLSILMKKEMRILLVLIPLIAFSVWFVNYFNLTIRGNQLAQLKEQVVSIGTPKIRSMPGANIKWRLDIWKQTLDEIKQKPILGWGFGRQVDYIIWKKRLSDMVAQGVSTGIVPAHNHILAITHKMGIVGLLVFLFINARIWFYGLFYVKKCRSEYNRRFLIASLGGLIFWHGMAFFFDILESPPTTIFLWILLAGILASVYTDQKEKKGEISNMADSQAFTNGL